MKRALTKYLLIVLNSWGCRPMKGIFDLANIYKIDGVLGKGRQRGLSLHEGKE